MIIPVGREKVAVDEPGNTAELAVKADQRLDQAQIAAALHASGLGRLGDDGHAWLAISELRARSVGPQSASAEAFDAMVAYAADRGWVAEDELRAHIAGIGVP